MGGISADSIYTQPGGALGAHWPVQEQAMGRERCDDDDDDDVIIIIIRYGIF